MACVPYGGENPQDGKRRTSDMSESAHPIIDIDPVDHGSERVRAADASQPQEAGASQQQAAATTRSPTPSTAMRRGGRDPMLACPGSPALAQAPLGRPRKALRLPRPT